MAESYSPLASALRPSCAYFCAVVFCSSIRTCCRRVRSSSVPVAPASRRPRSWRMNAPSSARGFRVRRGRARARGVKSRSASSRPGRPARSRGPCRSGCARGTATSGPRRPRGRRARRQAFAASPPARRREPEPARGASAAGAGAGGASAAGSGAGGASGGGDGRRVREPEPRAPAEAAGPARRRARSSGAATGRHDVATRRCSSARGAHHGNRRPPRASRRARRRRPRSPNPHSAASRTSCMGDLSPMCPGRRLGTAARNGQPYVLRGCEPPWSPEPQHVPTTNSCARRSCKSREPAVSRVPARTRVLAATRANSRTSDSTPSGTGAARPGRSGGTRLPHASALPEPSSCDPSRCRNRTTPNRRPKRTRRG